MVNAQQSWPLPDGTRFELLDYQVPLKAIRADSGIGKIDMFGLTEHGRAVMVELKVIGHSGGPSDPPPVALLEGLRYASIVEANLQRIADEVREIFGREMVLEKPDVLILGEADWWPRWLHKGASTTQALERKGGEIAEALGISIVFGSITNALVQYGQRTLAPRLIKFPQIEYSDDLPKSKMAASNARQNDSVDHEVLLQEKWWRYAKTLSAKDLDGHEKRGRPPVASIENPSTNLMLPSDSNGVAEIESAIRETDRHIHFRSFRSSQAMAQSVFGAFKAARRLDLLFKIPAECGRPAFGTTAPNTSLSMEVHVRTLNEPRLTQLDVLLETGNYRVAVECKFCEPEFGKCSRVLSKKPDKPVCNGTYAHQQGRQSRCALSEIGVSYWNFIPEVFDWNAAQDHCACPLLPTYQIVRNLLAAIVDSEGNLSPLNGHAVFVYDGRNPAYKPNGVADAQLRKAALACRVPGVIRRVTWQEISRVCSGAEDLTWLADALEEKHGIVPTI